MFDWSAWRRGLAAILAIGSITWVMSLPLKRAKRFLKGKSRLFSTSGLRRGMRYRLTRAGIEHCERLIPRLLPLL